ncbi:MAG: rRNA maturation RNase YbeY [Desulfobacteraceae bacterium]
MEQTSVNLPNREISRKVQAILNALGYEAYEISLVITGNDQIRALNEKYRGIARPTNVLAFPMLTDDDLPSAPKLLGDLVISAEKAEQEAEEAGITTGERVSQLLAHGVLHLVGYDHETGEDHALAMEKKSLELLRIIEDNPGLDAF